TAHRDMGKSHFLDLRDATGRIQIYIHAKEVGPELVDLFRLLDLGDFIGVEGTCFVTKSGEPTLKVRTFQLLTKALRPLPEKWHGLQDIEARYRQRYLDLVTNEHSRAVFEKRIAIVRETRRFFEDRGFLEVETPISLTIEHRNSEEKVVRTINLKRPWRRARYHDLVREVAGKDWFELSREQRRDRATNEFKLEILPQLADFEVTQHVFEKLIEEKTIDPLFVTHCPKELVPLAKQNVEDSSLVDVFELVINGAEIAPGYSELNDPLGQRQRLLEQAGEERQNIDEEFLLALEHGMP